MIITNILANKDDWLAHGLAVIFFFFKIEISAPISLTLSSNAVSGEGNIFLYFEVIQ